MQGCRTWLNDLQQLLVHGDDAVLVTLARTEGTTPREAGVKMIVARDRTFHTIGGGALEWHAVETGRQLLREATHGPSRYLERIAPDEHYSGAVTLAFERLTIADLGWVTSLGKRFAAAEASVRTVSFADESPVLLSEAEGASRVADCLLWDAGPLLTETIVAERFPITVFGAGHVGRALIRILGTLPCQVRWVDDRPTQLAARASDPLPPNVIADVCDDPRLRVTQAVAGTSFVVMSYSDALDQALAERILRRADYAYFGMIGSLAKRRGFEQILAVRGFDPTQVARMHCPIGVDGIQGSAPEIIAISVAAQLLQVREAMLATRVAASHAADHGAAHAAAYGAPSGAVQGTPYVSAHSMTHGNNNTPDFQSPNGRALDANPS